MAEQLTGTGDRALVARSTAIADAIAAGDSDEAEALMTAHMNTFTELGLQVIEGLLDDVLDWR